MSVDTRRNMFCCTPFCLSYASLRRVQSRRLAATQPGHRHAGQTVPETNIRHRSAVCDAAAASNNYPVEIELEPKVLKSAVIEAKGGPPRGIVHFLGGAFAGATPQLLYSLLLQLLSEAGYTVIATPYAVTFKHLDCAAAVRQSFLEAVSDLRSTGRGAAVPQNVPVFGIGHSNGALLHLLLATMADVAPYRGVVAISFNNRQVVDAIPVPLDNLKATMQAATASPLLQGMMAQFGGANGGGVSDVLSNLARLAPPQARVDPTLVRDVAPLFDQIGKVLDEVNQGHMDFTPTPQESRKLIESSYSVPHTLLVQFNDDTIDESQEMFSILRSRYPQGTFLLKLPGNHVTPCVADPQVQFGDAFGPADAFVAAGKLVAQVDIRRMTRSVVEWLDMQSATRALP